MSCIARKLLLGVSDQVKHKAVQPEKIASGLKFRIKEVEEFYHVCRENMGADQLQS